MLSAPFAELVKEVPPASSQGEAGLGERSGEVRGVSDLSKLETFPDVFACSFSQTHCTNTLVRRENCTVLWCSPALG